MERPKRYPSVLWPILLIGVGVIWLLNSLGYLPLANINDLRYWPVLLIVLGVDFLIPRRFVVVRVIIGVLLVAMVVVFLLAAPALNLPGAAGMQNKQIFEAIGNSTSAVVDLHLTSMPTRIHPLNDTQDLMQANIDYFGTLEYTATGVPVRRITLAQNNTGAPFQLAYDPNARWDIGFSTSVPLDLTIDGASGSATIDLTGLQLSTFTYDQGSGSFNITLPNSPNEYTVDATGGSGSMQVKLPEQTNLTLHLNSGSGSVHLNLPNNAGVRLEVRNHGSGSVNYPSSFDQISSSGEKEGVWQSPGYDSAVYKLKIICDDLGSGSFTLR